MKTITTKQKKNAVFIKLLTFYLIVLAVNNLNAQFQNNGALFIGNSGSVYVGSGAYNFGTGTTQTTTTRTDNTHGKIIFAAAVTTSGASDTHFLDGYGSFIGTTAFLFPVGQSGVYAPVRVTPSTTSSVDAAYYRGNPTVVGSTLGTTVGLISNTEYWNIKGATSASISLTWRASSVLSNIVSSTADLIIVGFNGTQWVAIPSAVDATSILTGTSNMTAGSITSTAVVDLSAFTHFTLGSQSGSCPPLVASSVNTKTWNGSWSPSAPTIVDPVVISTAYSGGSFACNSLVLDANVTLTDGQNLEVVNGVTGTGLIIMSSEASFVQRASGATAPTIELTKRSRNVMRRFDYIYWGTPITGNFLTQLDDAQAETATAANAFDLRYRYESGAGGGWRDLNAITTGRGFITRIKSQAPFTNATITDFINLKFTGAANNGDITVPITNNPAFLNGGTSHVLLANPYPSAIDAVEFLTQNTNIDGVIYLWAAGTANNGTGQLYSQADYIAYTLAGSTAASGITNTTFNGKIASGQGFKVKSEVTTGNVTFTNCMRLTADNNQFRRLNTNNISQNAPKDSYKLNMTGSNGVFSQILVSYMPEATLGYDRMYDAGRNSVSTAQLFSVFEGDGRRLAINARPTFVNTDVVPLGISKSNTTTESFTISITEKEGVFKTSDVNVFVHDMLSNTFHNLNVSDFTFTSNVTSLLGRFKIVYLSNTLSNPSFNNGTVTANVKNSNLSLQASQGMRNVEIYDLLGKKIFSSPIENLNNFTAPFNFPQSVYIVRVALENESIASFKLINEN